MPYNCRLMDFNPVLKGEWLKQEASIWDAHLIDEIIKKIIVKLPVECNIFSEQPGHFSLVIRHSTQYYMFFDITCTQIKATAESRIVHSNMKFEEVFPFDIEALPHIKEFINKYYTYRVQNIDF